MCSSTYLALCLAIGAGGRREADRSQLDALPAPVKARAMELWRRGRCLLSSVHRPAGRESAVPRDIGRTPVLAPRLIAGKGALLCYATHGRTLWAADDQGVWQVDAAAGKLVRRFGREHGLPDDSVHAIAPAGADVWLATRRGLARLDTASGEISEVADVRFALGVATSGRSGVWVVSDAGAWRLAPGARRWLKLPDFPGQAQVARLAARGFWEAWRRIRTQAAFPAVFATEDGLYVLCLTRLLRFDPGSGKWTTLSDQAWRAIACGRSVWVLTTRGVLRYNAVTGRTDRFATGEGLTAGRPVAMAATDRALFVASHPDYDANAGRFVGGGVSRLDLASGKWAVCEQVGQTDVRFATAVLADGDEAWAACLLYDRVVHLGAHPGMAHVKRWRPHASGLGLLHFKSGRWTVLSRKSLKTQSRWIMGQQHRVKADCIGPESVEALCRSGTGVWGVYRMVPERYYSGYFMSVGCLGSLSEGSWRSLFDERSGQLGLQGEQPDLLLISHSHGERIVLAEGHPVVLGLRQIGGRVWAICENGLCVHDAERDMFAPVVRVGFRFYWRVTAAAAAKDAVWLGGDAGTISRLTRASGRLELLGAAPGRRIDAIAVKDGRVVVRTSPTTAVLPFSLRSAPKLPVADRIAFDGGQWSESAGQVSRPASAYTCRRRSSYLYKAGKPVAFLRGVFRPTVLCEDPFGRKLWLAVYGAAASVPLPAEGSEGVRP